MKNFGFKIQSVDNNGQTTNSELVEASYDEIMQMRVNFLKDEATYMANTPVVSIICFYKLGKTTKQYIHSQLCFN